MTRTNNDPGDGAKGGTMLSLDLPQRTPEETLAALRERSTDKAALPLLDRLELALVTPRERPRVDTAVWEPYPDDGPKAGLMRFVRPRSVQEVYDDLRAIIGEYPEGGEEYFGPTGPTGDGEWPAGHVVVFAVTGGSEGHYIHVHVATGAWGEQTMVMLGKTFAGYDAAWRFAKRLYSMLGEV